MPTSVDDPRSDQFLGRIVHLHIPKTAGMALSEAFRQAFGDRLRVYPERYEMNFNQTDWCGFNFYTGHIGFKVAREIGGDLITVLRDPVERFLSTYFYMRQLYTLGDEVSHKTSLAARYDLDQFVRIRDEPDLEQELHNRMIWQIAHSHRLERRQELIDAGVTDDELVRIAISNLRRFTIVGIQTDMAGLAEAIRQQYGLRIAIGRANVTGLRPKLSDIPIKTLDQIEWWIDLDRALYSTWLHMELPVSVLPLGTSTNRSDHPGYAK